MSYYPPSALTGSGTVTSVTLTAPAEFSVAGSPVTSSGTLAITFAAASGNKVIASPSGGGSGAYAGRALVALDIPSITLSKISDAGTAAAADTGDFDAAGVAAAAIVSHTGLPDPHSQYALDSDLGTAAASDVGDFDAAGAAAAAAAASLPLHGTADAAATASACSGNAATATALQTARNINGVPFDGTSDIIITAGSAAPATAGYIIETADLGLPNAHVLTDSTGITWDYSVPGTVTGRLAIDDPALGVLCAPVTSLTILAYRSIVVSRFYELDFSGSDVTIDIDPLGVLEVLN